MILVIVIVALVTLIVVVSLTTLITNIIFNKKDTKEEERYSIDSLTENASLSQEIKAANKAAKKQSAPAKEDNKFVISQPEVAPQPIINNNEPEEPKKEETPIDPFNLNTETKSTENNNSQEEIEVFK